MLFIKRYLLLVLCLILATGVIYAKNIVIVGDSLSAAYGLSSSQGWVELLKEKIHAKYTIINLSTSGDTSSNGLEKLKSYLLKNKAEILILALGSNDALRGLSLVNTENNLAQILKIAQKNKLKILLLSNRLPPNLGKAYNQAYAAIFKRLSKKYQLCWVKEFLKGVADRADWMQADGLHPNEKGQSTILDNVWHCLLKLMSTGNKVPSISAKKNTLKNNNTWFEGVLVLR